MKVKKLVSLLLAVMLIVGMVPMNAMADESGATQWGTLDGGKAQGKISLMASTSAPTWTDSEDAGDVYPKKTTTDGAGKTIADEDEIAEYIVSANSWENVSGTTLNVEKGHTFYLGLKFSGENLDKGTDGQNTVTYKGITSAQALIQIDSNVVKLAEGDTQKNNFAAYMKINDIDTGNVLNKTLLSKTGSNYNFVDSAKKVTDGNFKTYMQDKYGTSVNAGSGVAADSDSSILVGIKGQNKGYAVASQAKWDIIIPLKIDGNTTETTTTISLQTKRGESKTYIEFTDKEQDNNTQVNPSGTNGPNYKKTEQDILVENNGTITINIVSNDPALKVDDANKTVGINNGGATLVVGINDKGTFNDDAATASNWVVKVGDNTLTADTDYCVTKDSGTQLTFTLNSSANVTDGKTITVEQAGSVKVTTKTGETAAYDGSIGTATFTAKAAPVVTFDHSSLELKASDGDLVVYSVNGGENWNSFDSHTNGDEYSKTLAASDFSGIADGETDADAIIVAYDSNKNIRTNVSVTRAAQPAALTIDYATEKTSNVGVDVEYRSDDGNSWTDGNASAVTLTPGSAEQTLKYRTKATTSALASTEKTLTVPARPELSVSAVTDADATKDGKTKVSVTGTDAYYAKITTSGGTVPSQVDSSNGTPLTNGASIELTTAETLYAQIPAGTSNFKSELVSMIGTGNTYGTVVIPDSIAVGAKEIVVTLRGSTTSTVDTNNVVVKKGDDSDALSGYSVATGDDSKSIKITLPAAALANEVYHITVNSAALTNGTNGSTAATGDVNVSGNGVTVTVKDQYDRTLNTATFVEQGDTEVYDLTSALNTNGRYVKEGTFTSAYGTVTLDATAGSEKLTFVANDTVNGSQNATITVTTYEVATVSTIRDKTWDGTKDVSYDKATFQNKRNSSVSTSSSVGQLESQLKITLDESDVGTQNASWSKVADEESNVYIEAGSASVEVVAATVSAVSIDSSEVKVAPGKISEVAAELAKQEIVKVEAGSNEEAKFTTTLDKLLTTTQIESILLDQARQAAYTAKTAETEKAAEDEFYEAWKAAYIAAENSETAGSGDALTEAELATAYENETEYAKAGSSYVWANKNADIQTAKDNALTTLKTTLTTEITNASSVDNNTDLSFALPFTGTFDSSLSVSASSSAAFSKNVQSYNASSASLTVEAKAYKATSSGGGVYQPNIELETNGFGTANGVVELDEEYKITKLPGLTGQKLGTVFKGWATQKGNANTIVKTGREVTTDMTLYAIVEGYMSGDTANGKRVARPDDSVTREEMITMLVRAAGIYDASIDYTTTFADAKNRWSTSYIGCAETAGILAGDAEGTARPKDAITREEAAILIAKTFKVDVAIGGTTEYVTDFDEVSSWAADYVAAMVNNGTSVGYPVNGGYEFQASNEITRAEVAAMINKYIGLTEELKTSLAADETIESPFADVQNRKSWIYANMVFATLNAPATSYVTEITYPTR